jgi:peptidoglycan/LPS O-acetylase OafA/YrhL
MRRDWCIAILTALGLTSIITPVVIMDQTSVVISLRTAWHLVYLGLGLVAVAVVLLASTSVVLSRPRKPNVSEDQIADLVGCGQNDGR